MCIIMPLSALTSVSKDLENCCFNNIFIIKHVLCLKYNNKILLYHHMDGNQAMKGNLIG